MTFFEYAGNMHMHTPYSDGADYHTEIARAAIKANLDFIIVTDHNILVKGVEGYYGSPETGHVLLLTGEEVHNRCLAPQRNHCLVYGIPSEMAAYATNPQTLIDEVQKAGGLTFLAHPFDKPLRWQKESVGISWDDWHIEGFTGLEVWNFMSNFKGKVKSPLHTFRHLFAPERLVKTPQPETLKKWDELLAEGHKVVAIGNADAHATRYNLGPIKQIIFPYDFLFNCINTHILTPTPFAGDTAHDAQLIYHALQMGRAFIANHIVSDPCGFRYTGQGGKGGMSVPMGGSMRLENGVTLQTLVPQSATIKLIRYGDVVHAQENVTNLTYVAREPGAYRVEVWQRDWCWILSNPIYVEPNLKSITSEINYPADA
ncbi:MAG: CehA/McbA family metallohydrolase [Chloroflexi bacterium]|nr:CehA/McbA family metallohydrolase [Chloroflexota bacterium]